MKGLCAALLCLVPSGLIRAEDPKIEWTTDLNKMKIPNAPIGGMVRGGAFKADVSYHELTGSLKFIQRKGNADDARVSVVLPIKNTAELAGMNFNVSTNGEKGFSIIIARRPNEKAFPEGQAFINGFALRLEFGENKDSKIMGKIYLCTPDKDKSVIAGTFVIQVQ